METTGAIGPEDVAYARKKVAGALADLPLPVLFTRVRLNRLPDPAVARPALAQVTVDLNGHLIRARVARETIAEAIDEVRDRLRDRTRRTCELQEQRRIPRRRRTSA